MATTVVTTDWGGDFSQLPDGDFDIYGRDVEGTDVKAVLQALYRRFTTESEGLWYDSTYGLNLLSALSDASTPKSLASLKSKIIAQALDDERIISPEADVQYNSSTETLTVTLTCNGAVGPFSLTMTVDKAAIKFSGINASA